ncbi:MAG TPA: TRAP transporter large permease subunit [Stellaceae bacterium]|nr:TRAP transporter large permease subunit [Stellaceae bacterium]
MSSGAEEAASGLPRLGRGLTLRLVDAAGEAVLAAALLGELAVVLVNVLARLLFGIGFLWTDEIARLALSTLTFIGGAIAFGHGHHGFVRVAIDLLPERARRLSLALADLLVLVLAAVVAAASWPVIAASWSERTPILQLPAAANALPLSAGMLLLALYAAERLGRFHRRQWPAPAIALALAFGAALATRAAWLPLLAGDGAIALALALLFIALLAGLPVAFALLLGTAGYLWASGAVPLAAIPQTMVQGTGNFVLLALPFFIFAGLIMERGGISFRLVAFVQACVGHLRGGLFQVMVVSMYLVSGLSGAKSADVAAVGSVMRDMLKRERYSLAEGAAVLAASATMGETVPPSIAMLILGSITKLSIAALFIGGLIPAGVIALCLMALIHLRARRSHPPARPRAPLAVVARSALTATPALLMPAMLFAGILLGVATPTEVSAFAVVYGLLLASLAYRALDARGFQRALADSAALTGMILFILAAANAFSSALTLAYVPQRLVALLHGVDDSTALFMLGSIALLVLVGSLLEGLPALNVLAPLLIPIAGQIGISELHYGIVLIIAMGLGAFMPPAGVGFYVCCAIARTGIEEASRAMLPYLAILAAGLLIVAFVPWLTLSLPHFFGFRG